MVNSLLSQVLCFRPKARRLPTYNKGNPSPAHSKGRAPPAQHGWRTHCTQKQQPCCFRWLPRLLLGTLYTLCNKSLYSTCGPVGPESCFFRTPLLRFPCGRDSSQHASFTTCMFCIMSSSWHAVYMVYCSLAMAYCLHGTARIRLAR